MQGSGTELGWYTTAFTTILWSWREWAGPAVRECSPWATQGFWRRLLSWREKHFRCLPHIFLPLSPFSFLFVLPPYVLYIALIFFLSWFGGPETIKRCSHYRGMLKERFLCFTQAYSSSLPFPILWLNQSSFTTIISPPLQARQYTDVAKFSLKCLACGTGLQGQSEAQRHAMETGHINFGEV